VTTTLSVDRTNYSNTAPLCFASTDPTCPLSPSLPVLLDVSSYNLSGMGCSAGIISIELVKNMLAAKPNSTALIVSACPLLLSLWECVLSVVSCCPNRVGFLRCWSVVFGVVIALRVMYTSERHCATECCLFRWFPGPCSVFVHILPHY
jgi:hypothetical protein